MGGADTGTVPARVAALSSGNGRTLLPEGVLFPAVGVGSDTYYSYKLSELVEFISDCRVRMDRFILLAVSGLKAPGERLKGMCFEHFMHVDTAFNRYVRDGKDALTGHFRINALFERQRIYCPTVGWEKRLI